MKEKQHCALTSWLSVASSEQWLSGEQNTEPLTEGKRATCVKLTVTRCLVPRGLRAIYTQGGNPGWGDPCLCLRACES